VTILVLEDEDVVRQGVSKMLRRTGLSVLEASDGSAALDVMRARKDDIDVLLLDITLPGTSSREVYDEARRLRPDLRVIVTSAHSRETASSSLAERIDYFIRKPFSLGDLIDMVRQALCS
jgi:two-component system cell cycle sensor histidine kinase/response regulator CckA